MARQYYVEGTKSYLIAAWVLAALSLWHIIDGWVPQVRWRGAETTAQFVVDGVPFEIMAREVGVRFNDRVIQILPMDEWDGDFGPQPVAPVEWRRVDDQFLLFLQSEATLAGLQEGLAENLFFVVSFDESEINADEVLIGSLAGQSVTLEGGVDGKYPNFPEEWHDFGLHEFYAYNRWTGVILGIAAIVCAYIHRVVR